MNYNSRQLAGTLLAALAEAPEAKRPAVVSRFIKFLRRTGQFSRYRLIVRQTERLHLAERGIKKVLLESAAPPSKELRPELERILGLLVWSERTRPELLAGLRIFIDDENLIDGSASRQLQKIFKVNG